MEPMSEMVSGAWVRSYLGGSDKPINRVTLWRWVRDGRVPQPVRLSARMHKWVRSEVEAARAKLIDARTKEVA
jgi:predicted site-specific integrase-resolvase